MYCREEASIHKWKSEMSVVTWSPDPAWRAWRATSAHSEHRDTEHKLFASAKQGSVPFLPSSSNTISHIFCMEKGLSQFHNCCHTEFTIALIVQEMLRGVLYPDVHDNGIEKRACCPKIGSSMHAYNPSRSLTYRTGLYPHPKHVLAFSPHCVFRCKFTST